MVVVCGREVGSNRRSVKRIMSDRFSFRSVVFEYWQLQENGIKFVWCSRRNPWRDEKGVDP